MKKQILYVLSFALVLGLSSCGKSKSDSEEGNAKKNLENLSVIACDQTFENVIQDEIEVYEYIYPKEHILPYYLSESACVDSFMNQAVKSIVIPRELTPEEIKYLSAKKQNPRSQQIAVDAIALIVNKDNPLDILSTDELSEILSGKVKKWDELSPSKLGEIEVVFDDAGSSTVKYMRDKLTGGEPIAAKVYAQGNCPKVIEAVKTHKNAIGFIGVSWLQSNLDGQTMPSTADKAKILEKNDTTELTGSDAAFNPDIKVLKIREADKVQAFKPYQADIYNGDYPFYRPIYMITTATGGMASHRFFSFVTGVQGQKILLTTGVMPAIVNTKRVELR